MTTHKGKKYNSYGDLMEKPETKVKEPIQHMSISTWGMDGLDGRHHKNIARLNNAIFKITNRNPELLRESVISKLICQIQSLEERVKDLEQEEPHNEEMENAHNRPYPEV